MEMKQRKWTILLAGAASIALLAGCGSSGTPVEEAPVEDTSVTEPEQPEETVEPLTATATMQEKTFDVDLTVTASGGVEPYTYQWQAQWIVEMTGDDAEWSDWEDEPGATNAVYTIPVTDGIQYRCIVTDSAGTNVTLSPEFIPNELEELQEMETSHQEDWERAYLDFIVQDDTMIDVGYADEVRYYLLNLDSDAIPELYINYGFTYAGAKICTWDGDQVNFVNVGAGDELFYYEKGTCFHVSGGRMDHYYDVVFQIKNGRIQEKVRGEWEVLSYEPEEVTYTWNGKNVSESDYQASLTYMFDDSGAKQAEDQGSYSYDEIRNVLS